MTPAGRRDGCSQLWLSGGGGAGASFYVQAPFAYGDEAFTASREDVLMSQLVWFGFWSAHTLVACSVLAGVSRRRAAPADDTVTASS